MSSVDFDSYLNPGVIDRVKSYLAEKDYNYLNIQPEGDYKLPGSTGLNIVVFFATISKNDKIYDAWILYGGWIGMYNFATCTSLADALCYHMGMLITRGFFDIVPTKKVVLG